LALQITSNALGEGVHQLREFISSGRLGPTEPG
jgi:hypothetical protein